MKRQRVVITGIAPVSAIGIGRESFAEALRQGRSGIAPISLFEPDEDGAQLAAQVNDFAIEDYLESRKGYLDRSAGFALAAISLALEDAGLTSADVRQAGLALGSAFGSLDTAGLFYEGFLEKGPRLVKPFLFPHTYANTAISLAAIEFDIHGPHINFASGAVASGQAITAGYDMIRSGKADLVLAGGYEALNEFIVAAHEADGALYAEDDAGQWANQLGEAESGMILGEGAGLLVLESLQHATARGARIHCELAGAGLAGGKEGALSRAAQNALQECDDQNVELVLASATGLAAVDRNEADALSDIAAGDGSRAAVLRLKAQTGETLGASCALQAIAAVIALQDGLAGTLSYPGLNSCQNNAIDNNFRALTSCLDPNGNAVCLVLQSV